MTTFNKIQYKNILSVGNHHIVVDLNKNHKTLIIGKNGAGKTTLSDALFFVLFGTPYRNINKNDIINSINKKNLEVTVWFENKSNKYKVIRGLKPNIFEIYQNDILLEQPAKIADYQKILENCLGFDRDMLLQIGVIGTTNYEPFMRLSAGRRREFIDNVLKLHVISRMSETLKQKISENKETISELTKRKQINESKIEVLKDVVKTYQKEQKEQKEEIEKEILDSETLLKNKNDETLERNKQLQTLKEKASSLEKYLHLQENLQSLQIKSKTKIEIKKKESDFFLNSTQCQVCKQAISDLAKESFKQDYELFMKEVGQESNKINDALSKIQENVKIHNDIQNQINVLSKEIYEIDVDKKSLEKKILELKQKNNHNVSFKIKEKLIEIKKLLLDIEKINTDHDKALKNKLLHSMATPLLKDDGIKASIIKQYIPILNEQIEHHLELLNFYVEFNLDENFEEVIKSRYRDTFKYNNFSEGEKQRIDLAILFSFRKLAEIRFSVTTNIIILDETLDASMDNNGVKDLIDILDENKHNNIFVISHKNSMSEFFDNTIEFEKKKNFTVLMKG